jgi:hypothetical protein
MRAIRARYNPFVQARGRVDQLRKLGHSVDKVRSYHFLMKGCLVRLDSVDVPVHVSSAALSVSRVSDRSPYGTIQLAKSTSAPLPARVRY